MIAGQRLGAELSCERWVGPESLADKTASEELVYSSYTVIIHHPLLRFDDEVTSAIKPPDPLLCLHFSCGSSTLTRQPGHFKGRQDVIVIHSEEDTRLQHSAVQRQ